MGDSNNGGRTPKVETSDFMGFSIDTQGTPNNQFKPRNYSSPQANQRLFFQNNSQWGQKRFNNYNSPYQYNNRNSYGGYNSQQSPNRFNNSNRSFHSGQKQFGNQNFNRNHNNGQNRSFRHNTAMQDHNNTFNRQLFLHPSFMENPWAGLEKELDNAQQSKSETTTCNTSMGLD